MKYIRTKDGIYEIVEDLYLGRFLLSNKEIVSLGDDDVKIADAVEELCDKWIIIENGVPHILAYECDLLDKIDNNRKMGIIDTVGYGAIWIKLSNGAYRLEPVAKFNEEWGLELL